MYAGVVIVTLRVKKLVKQFISYIYGVCNQKYIVQCNNY